jgi:hypothetical protein
MSDFFDTSRIPDDSEHWDRQAARVTENVMRDGNAGGFGWVARSRAGLVAASLLVAAALVLAMLPGETGTSTPPTIPWASALAPADDVGRIMIAADQPPQVGDLLVAAARERR